MLYLTILENVKYKLRNLHKMEIYHLVALFLGFSALIVYLFERIGLSRIAGYIIAGIVLSFFFSETLKANIAMLNFFPKWPSYCWFSRSEGR